VGQIFEPLHELAHDPKDAPGISVQELVGMRRFQQPLILSAPMPVIILVVVFVFHSHFPGYRREPFNRQSAIGNRQ
jgi:hypothetical protein